MEFNLSKSIEVLKNTPLVLDAYLSNLSDDWINNNEGDLTWSPYDVLGHLVFGEKTDWMVRIQIILSDSEQKIFEPFDRFAQFSDAPNETMGELIHTFKHLRAENVLKLENLNISETQLKLKGIHPEFGEVTLEQLISTWVVHDLGHIAQISRVMARQYKQEVGPWIEYLGILKK
ncbi:MAG: DinB family protein [Flavobacteriales bacterium]